MAAFRLLSSYFAICDCCVSIATANRIQAWPCGQALSMIWTAYAVLCVPQLLCVHSECIIVFQPSLLRPSALSILWTAYRPRCAACSDFPIAFQPGLTAKHMLSYPSARSPPALRGASACSTVLATEMLTAYDWPHHDCLLITLRSAMAVYPHSDCIIAFQLGLTAKHSF